MSISEHMGYISIDPSIWDNLKVVKSGSIPLALFLYALCWLSKHGMRDTSVIPAKTLEDAQKYFDDPLVLADRLVGAGIWATVFDGSYLIADWMKCRIVKPRYNPESHRDAAHRRRACKAHAPVVQAIRRSQIIARDNGVCYLCGKMPEGTNITLDHVIPLSKGGHHAEYNLRVACRSCNSRKGARYPSAKS